MLQKQSESSKLPLPLNLDHGRWDDGYVCFPCREQQVSCSVWFESLLKARTMPKGL